MKYAIFSLLAASSGTADADFERLTEILTNVKDLKFVCLDVANGYSQHFVEYLRRVRAAFPTHTIIVSGHHHIIFNQLQERRF